MTKRKLVSLKPSDLTPGEKLIIHRRREGLTQADMASQLDISLLAYRAIELDEEHIPCGHKAPRIKLGTLALHEQAVILRMRSGMSQAETCDSIGISKWWLRRMETNDDCNTDRLFSYWNLI